MKRDGDNRGDRRKIRRIEDILSEHCAEIPPEWKIGVILKALREKPVPRPAVVEKQGHGVDIWDPGSPLGKGPFKQGVELVRHRVARLQPETGKRKIGLTIYADREFTQLKGPAAHRTLPWEKQFEKRIQTFHSARKAFPA